MGEMEGGTEFSELFHIVEPGRRKEKRRPLKQYKRPIPRAKKIEHYKRPGVPKGPGSLGMVPVAETIGIVPIGHEPHERLPSLNRISSAQWKGLRPEISRMHKDGEIGIAVVALKRMGLEMRSDQFREIVHLEVLMDSLK